jgi:hypothetical protein
VFLNQHGKPDFEGDEYQCKCKKFSIRKSNVVPGESGAVK